MHLLLTETVTPKYMMPNTQKNPKTYFKDFEGNSMFFVTIVCKYRKPILSRIVNHEIQLTEFGQIVENSWNDQSEIHPQVEIGKYVLMPDHLHGIIKITQSDEYEKISLSTVVHGFKTYTTNQYFEYGNSIGINPIGKLWVKGYNEQWIGKGSELTNIETYILENPKRYKQPEWNPS